MVHPKNFEGPVGGKDKSGSVTDGRHDEKADDYYEKKTAWISGVFFEGG